MHSNRSAPGLPKPPQSLLSKTSITFLDLRISIVNDRFEVKPFFKDAALTMPPLGVSSAHPRGVQRWPLARMSTLRCNATFPEDGEQAVNLFKSAFVNNFEAIPETIKMKNKNGDEAGKRENVWLTLPFHPCYERNITQAVSRFNSSAEGAELHYLAHAEVNLAPRVKPQIKIAWRNVLSSSSSQIAKICRSYNT